MAIIESKELAGTTCTHPEYYLTDFAVRKNVSAASYCMEQVIASGGLLVLRIRDIGDFTSAFNTPRVVSAGENPFTGVVGTIYPETSHVGATNQAAPGADAARTHGALYP